MCRCVLSLDSVVDATSHVAELHVTQASKETRKFYGVRLKQGATYLNSLFGNQLRHHAAALPKRFMVGVVFGGAWSVSMGVQC